MRRFSAEEVIGILSQDHLRNTAQALQKETGEVTADELVIHWLKFHVMTVIQFNVEPTEDESGWLFT